ncbi:hypothetical protein CRENBAI_004656 [Crenichthys baileyi]|uniref:Coiled-coil domain-containing protein 30 n=1 Tax=Crenichthys baileyi TaxID=28760 RepID=A0AAV9RN51_9TELE
MAQAEIMKWLTEEGLAPESSKEAQLTFLWRTFLHARSCLDNVTKDLETSRLQHFAEMAEVRKSLEQIKILTEQKDVLAQEIQDENEQLRKQLLHLVSLQDAQINEVAKMLYQQGLTELIHSTPSEQVAYLLVERASLLERNHDPGELTCDGDLKSRLRTHTEPLNTSICPGGETLLAGQQRSLEKECSRLERDVEEGSRRLAMAHNEIRRLKDELESAHFTQKAYEPELQSAQEEVEQLRKEVEKLKQYEMVELQKAKEHNDRLDLEIRALRNRVRSLDAEKNALKKMVASQQEEAERLKSALQGQQRSLTGEVKANQDNDKENDKTEGAELTKSDKLYIYMQEKFTAKTRQPMENQKGRSGKTDVIQVEETCKDEQNNPSINTNCLLQKQPEKQCCQLLENYHHNMNTLIAQPVRHICSQWEFSCWTKEVQTQPLEDSLLLKECPGCLEARKTLLYNQDEHEAFKRQICEALNCIDEERSKYHSMKEKCMEKLCRTKQKLDAETAWRDNKINNLERELSLCCHSLKKEKEVVECITMENERLLSERRELLQQLSEEEDNMKNSKLTACLSKSRVEYLEAENRSLGNKMLQMSHQIATLERRLQNMQSLQFAEELQKMSTHQQKFKPLSVWTARLMLSDIQDLLDPPCSSDTKQADLTSSPGSCASATLCRTAELGYLNLSASEKSSPQSAFITSENKTS